MTSSSCFSHLEGSTVCGSRYANSLLLRRKSGGEACCSRVNQGLAHSGRSKRSLGVSATLFESEVLPRQSSLPESWDARSLDDEAISEELHRLKLKRKPVLPRTLSTKRIRSVRSSRLKFRTRSSAARTSDTFGVVPGRHLSIEQQRTLCAKWQEWQRIQQLVPEVSLSVDQHTKAWAAAAGLSEKELKRVEAEGPRAAHLLLASVERLLYQISQRCYAAGRDIEDIVAEARNLWLDAAAKCDVNRASLNSFGILYVRQRLPGIVDEQNSLLQQPGSSQFNEYKVFAIRQELESRLGREPTVEEICIQGRLSRANVQNVLKSSRNTVSLDRPIDGDASDGPETTMGDNLARDIDPESESGMDSEMKRDMEETLQHLMDKNLTKEGERKVCNAYYGFGQQKSKTLREISTMYDMSIETVRKRLIKARAHLNKNGELEREMKPYVEEGTFASASPDDPIRVVDITAQDTKN